MVENGKLYNRIYKERSDYMINGKVEDFLEGIYNLQEIIHIYNGKKYFLQGYGGWKGEPYTLELQLWEPEQKNLWKYVDKDPILCRNKFLKEPLYDGKTFWEVESEIEWVDE